MITNQHQTTIIGGRSHVARGVVDVASALDALRRCASEPDVGIGSTLVQSVAGVLGLPDQTIALLRSPEPAHRLWRNGGDGFSRLTLGAIVVLRAADTAERSGEGPFVSCRRATEALSRYLYFVPRSKLRPVSSRVGRAG